MTVTERMEFLRDFLIKNNAYDAWIEAVRNHRWTKHLSEKDAVDSVFNFTYCTEVFLVFCWGDTKEGNKFWNELNTKWLKLFKQ